MLNSIYNLKIKLLFLLALLLSLPALAEAPPKTGVWVQNGQAWTCANRVTVNVPDKFKASVEDKLLGITDGTDDIYVAYAWAENKAQADKFLAAMKKHLKKNSELKLGKVVKLTGNPKLNLTAREGVSVMDKVPYAVTMGYYTDKSGYLPFLAFYPVAKRGAYDKPVAKMMNSIIFK